MTLDFLKMKMAGETAAARAADALATANSVKGSTNADCPLKGSIEIGPGMSPCQEKMKISINLQPSAQADSAGHPLLVVSLACHDGSKATSVCSSLEKLIGKGLLPPILTPSTSGSSVIIKSTEQPPPPNMAGGLSFIMAAMKKIQMNVSCGGTFSDVIKAEDVPVIQGLKGMKFAVDLLVTGDGKEFATLNSPPPAQELMRLFAGADAKLHFGYNEDRLKSGILGQIFGPSSQFLFSITPKEMRANVEMRWAQSQPPPEVLDIYAAVKEIAAGVKQFDQIKMEKLPGGTELVITFTDFNPFQVLSYVLQPLDKWPQQMEPAG